MLSLTNCISKKSSLLWKPLTSGRLFSSLASYKYALRHSTFNDPTISLRRHPKAINFYKSQVRSFSSTLTTFHGHLNPPKPGEELHITFVLKDGEQKTFEVSEGDSLLDIAQAHNLDMEGACGGSCACSTCHVIVDPDYIDALPEPEDDENDMLDLAYGLTETSRLGCQVKMSKEVEGLRVALPAMTRNVSNNDFSNN
ncbi:hypothetical protein TBLA_0G01750 [Henningerozyma blattae CBS 6284]|uniref:2Fe-2S ferredoxin-type domain-containing protein n=1 Tax=Henningerozyma blattae (strain ATCC 34711 / CBS 6284 / DSM 70876 / NBRC 10599 / NRRL Y-10934 / UCD 77-7) TaxID=1071380 RepID=I2H6W6_HENB6|nr:hypothetical protein TBLA_0G01750 [Tetrapisispora blattae CBS 6284]CCH62118.1 hypothetical protein TBLA_0G01750 [Tetrapisispora blattae CBS 6284]